MLLLLLLVVVVVVVVIVVVITTIILHVDINKNGQPLIMNGRQCTDILKALEGQ